MLDLDSVLVTLLLTVTSTPTLILADCSEQEFQEVRNKYEGCANQKIEFITELLQRPGNTETRQDVVICDQVKQLINHCGQLLDQCFKLEQVRMVRCKVSHPSNPLTLGHFMTPLPFLKSRDNPYNQSWLLK